MNPAKTVTCSICGKIVTKASTLMRKDGTRACREHDGVYEESRDRVTSEQEQRNKKEERISAKKEFHHKRRENPAKPYCMICGSFDVVPARDYAMGCLIGMKKFELTHNRVPNMFDRGDMAKALGPMSGKRPLEFVSIEDNPDILKLLKSRDDEMVVQALGAAGVCSVCVSKNELVTPMSKMANRDPIKMLEFGAVIGAVMDKPIEDEARRQLIRDN